MSTLIQELNSQNHWLADGVQTVWNFNFTGGYISREHVKAYTKTPAGVRTDLVVLPEHFVGDFQLLIEPAVTSGHTLVIYRATPKDLPLVDFEDTGDVNEINLDTTAKQAVFIAAESADFLGVTTSEDLAQLAAQASASAGAAAASATNASTSQTAAASSAAAAAGSATAAAGSATAAATSAANAAATTTAQINLFKADLVNATDPTKGAYGLLANAAVRVATVAALKALPAPTRSTVAYSEGYTAAGDGCGGVFVWMSASTKADDATLVFQPDSLPASGRWERIVSGGVHVSYGGARGDDSTDDYAALVRAEAAAFTAGLPLVFGDGRIYRSSASLVCRVSVVGNDATIRCTAGTQSLTNGLLHYASVTNISVRDLRLNCNSTRRGLLVNGGTNVRILNVHVTNALFGGIAVYSGTNVSVLGCSVDGSIYVTDGTGAGDGFYFHASNYVRVTQCYAANFERIGFVSEGEVSGTKSDNVLFTACVARDAKNCDRSTTEFNAAFWHENTNNVSYVNCTGVNIASGVGQTSGRVRGFQSAVGSNAVCKVDYVNCRIVGNTNNIPFGFVTQGSTLLPSVSLTNCFVNKCVVGLTCIGGIDTLTITDFKADVVVTAFGSQGAVTFDIASNQLNELRIDGLEVTNRTYLADAADINFFTCHSGLRYKLTRAKRCTHVMRQAATSVSVDESIIEYGSATYASFIATELRFGSRFIGFLRSGAVSTNLWNGNAMSGATIYFDGCRLGSESATQVTQDCAGTNINIVATGATFDYLNLTIRITGTYNHIFTGCRMLNCNATTGFYLSNPLAPTKQVLMVTGCRLEGVSAAATPLRKSTNNPNFTILQSNTYSTTNLHDFTAGVTAANNTLV